MNCDLGAEDYIIEELKQIPEVSHAYITFGAYDIIAEIDANSHEEFDETVSIKIRQLKYMVIFHIGILKIL